MITETLRNLIGALASEDADLTEITAEMDGIDTVSDGAQARIAELESALADAEDRYTQTAAKNYELMLSATGEPSVPGGEDTPEGESDDDIINSLFKED